MAVNSKSKGNTFERQVVKILSEHFNDEFKRTPSSGAITGGSNRSKVENLREDAREILSGDIIVPDGFDFAIECKAYKDEPYFHHLLQGSSKVMDDWIEQADEDAKYCNKQPLIIFKVNRKGTYAAFDVTLKDINYDGQSFLLYRHKIITTLDVFLDALGESHYNYRKEKESGN